MNLLVGPNGTGKTSLLEAIELCLCGNTFRSGGEPENDAIINLRFKGSTDFEAYEPKNNKKYQQRDLAWYGRSISRGNDLHVGFNRYNFYNADSAYRLSHETRPEDIDSAFAAIALGERANHIDRRLREFEGDFDDKFKSLDQQLRNLDKEIADQRSRIELHAKVESNAKSIYISLVRESESLSLIDRLPSDSSLLKGEFDSGLYDLDSALKEVCQYGTWIRPLSIENVLTEREILTSLKIRLKSFQEKISNLRKQDTEFDGKKSVLNSRLKTLKQAKAYFEFDRIDELPGVGEKARRLKSTRDKFVRAEKAIAELDIEVLKLLDGTKTLDMLRLEAKTAEEAIKAGISNNESSCSNLEKTLSRTQALLTQLNSIAREYSELHPDAYKCPLCDADHAAVDLKKIIQGYRAPDASSLELLELKLKITEETGLLNKNLSAQLNISRAMSLRSLLSDANGNQDAPLSTLFDAITDVPKFLLQSEDALREVAHLQERIEGANLSETEYKLVSSQMAMEVEGFPIVVSNRDKFDAALKKAETELDTIAKSESSRLSEIDLLTQGRSELIVSYLTPGGVSLKDGESEVERRAAVIERLLDKTKLIRSMVSLPDSKSLEEIGPAVGSVARILKEFRKSIEDEARADIEVRDAKKKIDDTESFAKTVRPQYERAKKALEEIQGILKKDNKESALAGFIEQNRTGIDAIFSKIHSPREFAGLVPGSTHLKKIGTNDQVPLSRVSTGQRAALALSLFFALNASLRKAPPVILIDDPVAHVDDLNTLSFLDYLRELVIGGERQIFFATASQKLGNLIEKKFQFLGSETFKKYEFSR